MTSASWRQPPPPRGPPHLGGGRARGMGTRGRHWARAGMGRWQRATQGMWLGGVPRKGRWLRPWGRIRVLPRGRRRQGQQVWLVLLQRTRTERSQPPILLRPLLLWELPRSRKKLPKSLQKTRYLTRRNGPQLLVVTGIAARPSPPPGAAPRQGRGRALPRGSGWLDVAPPGRRRGTGATAGASGAADRRGRGRGTRGAARGGEWEGWVAGGE